LGVARHSKPIEVFGTDESLYTIQNSVIFVSSKQKPEQNLFVSFWVQL